MAAPSTTSAIGGQTFDADVTHQQRNHPPQLPPHIHAVSSSRSNNSSVSSDSQLNRKRTLYQNEADLDHDELTKHEPSGRDISSRAASPADSIGNSASDQRRFSDDVHIGDLGGTQTNKKRKTGPGSRGVANLTPDQLAKKRANDREAQRAIRERQKAKSQEYEKRIRELESQQPYQELQAALRLKDVVEAENSEIKRILSTVVAMIQPILSRPSDHGHHQPPVYPSPNQTYIPVGSSSVGPHSMHTGSTPTSTASPVSGAASHGHHWPTDLNHAIQGHNQAYTRSKVLDQQRHDLAHGLDMGTEKLGLDFLLDSAQRITRMQEGMNNTANSPQFRQIHLKHDWSAPAMHATGQPSPYAAPNNNISGNGRIIANGAGRGSTTTGNNNHSGARLDYPLEPLGDASAESNSAGPEDWSTPVQNCAPTCPLDSLMLDFLNERRQRAAEGHPPQDIVGPRYPSISLLVNPERSKSTHPLTKVFVDIIATFPGLSALPEKIAVLYFMFILMRWQISPTRENYLRIPDFFRPRPVQLYRQHPAWVEYVIFPLMRETFAQNYGSGANQIPFEDFFIPWTNTLSVNWPYEDMDALLCCPGGDDLMINPVFERHIARLENWTLGDAFHAAFPQLEGTYNLKSTQSDSGIED